MTMYLNKERGSIDLNELKIGEAYATGGSFELTLGTYAGDWYEAHATDSSGREWTIIWTKVNWDAEEALNACDWDSPDYIFDEHGYDFIAK